jgi:hypothetical protein
MGKTVSKIFGAKPPKQDNSLKEAQQEQLKLQKARQAQQDAELVSARRARSGGGYGRSGLFYSGPAQATDASKLGGS